MRQINILVCVGSVAVWMGAALHRAMHLFTVSFLSRSHLSLQLRLLGGYAGFAMHLCMLARIWVIGGCECIVDGSGQIGKREVAFALAAAT